MTKKSQSDISAKAGSGQETKTHLEAVRDDAVSLSPPSPSRRIPRAQREVHVALCHRARAAGGRGAATRPRARGRAGGRGHPRRAVPRRRALDTDGGVLLTARGRPDTYSC